jgi:hypothetical protein
MVDREHHLDAVDDDVLQEDAAPAKALAAAQMQEHARVSLSAALETTLHIFRRRGFTPTHVGAKAVETFEEASAAIQEYRDPDRAAEAERIREIILEGVVPDPAPEYTTAWALGYAPGTRIAVSVISAGNVEVMRAILTYLEGEGMDHVLILHRNELTAPARKFLDNDPTGARVCTVQHMSLFSLQKPIDKIRMTPPHIPMHHTMVDKLGLRFGDTDKFPHLLTTDAMVRFLGLPKGALVMTLEAVGAGPPTHRWYKVAAV